MISADTSKAQSKVPEIQRVSPSSLTLRSVAQSSVLVIIGLLVGRGGNVLLRIVLGRALGPADLGMISTVWTLVTMFGVIAIVGLTPTVTRFLALYLQHGNLASARAVLLETFAWTVLAAGGLAVLTAGFAPAIAARWLGSPDFAPLILTGAIAVPAWALLLWLVASFRGLGETVPSVLTKDISRTVFAIAFLGILWSQKAIEVETAVRYLYVLPVLLACGIGFALLWPRIKYIILAKKYRPERRKWLHFAWPLSLSMLLQNTTGRSIDILLLGYLASTADVGLYVSALSIVGLSGLALQGVNFLALPLFTGSTKQTTSAHMQQIRMLTFELTLPATLVLILWPGILTRLTFGDAFSAAILSIPVLTIGFAVSNFFGPVGQLLLAEGRTRWYLLADISSMAVFLMVAIGLIPLLNVLGVALARSLSQIVFNVVAWIPFGWRTLVMSSRIYLDVGGIFLTLGVLKILMITILQAEIADNILVPVLLICGGIFMSCVWLLLRWRFLFLDMVGKKKLGV